MSIHTEISSAKYLQLCGLIKKTLGLYFPPKKKEDLLKGILEFSSEINAKNLDECIEHILITHDSQKMCERLASHLTVGETYFYRHSKQFDTIKNKILSNIFLDKKKSSGQKSLRIWSSACCTGEEAYTLAMLIDKLPYDFRDWDVRITGSDLNPVYLQKAKAGIYSNWSFREKEKQAVIGKYFTDGTHKKKVLSTRIKSKVNFIYHNLATDEYPAMFNGTNGLDIIFCRNALIYFDLPTIKKVLKKLYNCLIEGGILVVAPAETPIVSSMKLFKTVKYDDVFLFKKEMTSTTKTLFPIFNNKKPTIKTKPAAQKIILPKLAGSSLKTIKKPKETKELIEKERIKTPPSLKVLQSSFKNGDYYTVINVLDEKFIGQNFVTPLSMDTIKEIIMLIKSYANIGKLKEADYWSSTAIDLDKLIPEFYYIRATILQELGKEDEMAKTLRKAIYINNKYIPAYFLFGLLMNRQNKNNQAKKHLNRALALLNSLKADKILEEVDGLTVNRLKAIISSMLL